MKQWPTVIFTRQGTPNCHQIMNNQETTTVGTSPLCYLLDVPASQCHKLLKHECINYQLSLFTHKDTITCLVLVICFFHYKLMFKIFIMKLCWKINISVRVGNCWWSENPKLEFLHRIWHWPWRKCPSHSGEYFVLCLAEAHSLGGTLSFRN